MNKDICITCCRRYRKYPNWLGSWGTTDEDYWKRGIIQCPGILHGNVSSWRFNEKPCLPPWCAMALEHLVLGQRE